MWKVSLVVTNAYCSYFGHFETYVTFPSRASVCKPASVCRWRLCLHREPSGVPEEPASVPADETDHPAEPGSPTGPAAAAGPRQSTAAAGSTPAHLQHHTVSLGAFILCLLAGYVLRHMRKALENSLQSSQHWRGHYVVVFISSFLGKSYTWLQHTSEHWDLMQFSSRLTFCCVEWL